MPKKHVVPFSCRDFDTTIESIAPPSDLKDFIKLGSQVFRYKFEDNNYDHIFEDRVDEHTKRMVLYAQQLPLSEEILSSIIRTLWVHDIPEIICSQENGFDMTSTDKILYPHKALLVKKREEETMQKIFSLQDRQLYHAFEPVKEMLFTGTLSFSIITPAALVARVIDTCIDGINSFHGFVTEYLESDQYNPELPLPKHNSFEYCFGRGIDMYRNILNIEEPDFLEVKFLLIDIMRKDFFDYIHQVWSDMSYERLPQYAQKELDAFRQCVSEL